MGLSKKEVVFILRRRARAGVGTVGRLLDLEANRIEKMDDKEFETYARNFVNKPNQTVFSKKV